MPVFSKKAKSTKKPTLTLLCTTCGHKHQQVLHRAKMVMLQNPERKDKDKDENQAEDEV